VIITPRQDSFAPGDTMGVYAYYKPPYIQTMREHVLLALEAFPAESKLVIFGSSLTRSFHKALKLAVVLHDFGKTPFNQAKAETLQSERELTFPGHELISGWIAYKALVCSPDAAGILGVPREELTGNKLGQIISLVIMLHHHPMDLRKRLDMFKKDLTLLQVSKHDVDVFTNSLKGILNVHIGLDEDLFHKLLVNAIGEGEVSAAEIAEIAGQIFNQLTNTVLVNSAPIHRKIFLLLLQGLVAADYCSARARGGDSVSVFSESIRMFVELYGGKC